MRVWLPCGEMALKEIGVSVANKWRVVSWDGCRADKHVTL